MNQFLILPPMRPHAKIFKASARGFFYALTTFTRHGAARRKQQAARSARPAHCIGIT
jgi:hypothetical protein